MFHEKTGSPVLSSLDAGRRRAVSLCEDKKALVERVLAGGVRQKASSDRKPRSWAIGLSTGLLFLACQWKVEGREIQLLGSGPVCNLWILDVESDRESHSVQNRGREESVLEPADHRG